VGARVRPLAVAGLPPFSLPGRGADARRAGTRDQGGQSQPDAGRSTGVDPGPPAV